MADSLFVLWQPLRFPYHILPYHFLELVHILVVLLADLEHPRALHLFFVESLRTHRQSRCEIGRRDCMVYNRLDCIVYRESERERDREATYRNVQLGFLVEALAQKEHSFLRVPHGPASYLLHVVGEPDELHGGRQVGVVDVVRDELGRFADEWAIESTEK